MPNVEETLTLNVRGAPQVQRAMQESARAVQQWRNAIREQNYTLAELRQQVAQTRAQLTYFRTGQEQSRAATKQATQELQMQLAALRQVATEQANAERAVERNTKAWSLNLKKMALWAIGARTTFRVVMQIRNWLRESYDALYGNTEQVERFDDAMRGLGNALVYAITGGDTWLETLDKISERMESFQTLITTYGAAWTTVGEVGEAIKPVEGWARTLDDIGDAIPFFNEAQGAIVLLGEQLGFVHFETELATHAQKIFNEELAKASKALKNAAVSGKEYDEALKDIDRSIDRAADLSLRYMDVMDDWRESILEAQETLSEDLIEAEDEYWESVQNTEERAFKDRRNAWEDYYKRINKLNRQQQQQQSNLEERHRLQMLFAERRHRLETLNNEALYQYERGRLVAEGDVLAIEDLDARYQLERQAREENFRLQQQQAEAMYQLQLRQQQEAIRQQTADLFQALQERLAEIEQRRRERIEIAQEERDESIKIAHEEYFGEVQEQRKALNERLKDQARFWAKYLMDMGIGFDQAQTIVQARFGAGSVIDQEFTYFWNRRMAEMMRFSMMLGGMLGGGTLGGFGAAIGTYRRVQGFQYGGEMVATRPTPIIVGEGGAPERVSVQPLSPIGGTLGVQWQGSPIPVHGSGSLSGANLNEIGQAIQRGLVVGLRTTVGSYRGQRGG